MFVMMYVMMLVMMNINYCMWDRVYKGAWFNNSTHLSVMFTSF